MTRGEAIINLNMINVAFVDPVTKEQRKLVDDTFCMAIKALRQGPILDKIRAEIDEQYDKVHPYNLSCAEGLEMALGIIDKYKAESEDKE